jgi:hypothetical protein
MHRLLQQRRLRLGGWQRIFLSVTDSLSGNKGQRDCGVRNVGAHPAILLGKSGLEKNRFWILFEFLIRQSCGLILGLDSKGLCV